MCVSSAESGQSFCFPAGFFYDAFWHITTVAFMKQDQTGGK